MSQSVNNIFLKKTILAGAVAGALGAAMLPQSALATVYQFSFAGANGNVFTMLQSTGGVTTNSDLNFCNPDMLSGGFCVRTAINGSITYDTVAGTGTMSINPFSFFGSGVAAATTITFQAIGNGSGGPGTLVLGNMSFFWNNNNGIPVSIVWDAAGLFNAINGGLSPGDTVTGGTLPASNNTIYSGASFPIGPAVMAVTTWNTTSIGTPVLGTNPSGTLPLVTDTIVDSTNGDTGIGGSPMPTAPFQNFNANFDFTNLLVTCVDANCGQGVVTNTTPVNGSPVSATISVTFSRNMKADTVAGAISLIDVTNGNAPVNITVTPSSAGVLASIFTITLTTDQNPATAAVDLAYSTQYQATVATTAQDEDGNNLAASPNNTWTWTTQAAPQVQVCQSGIIGPAPLGGNFSMLEKLGKVFGGTNDITYSLDFVNLNTTSGGNAGITTNTLASALPHPFFGAVWTAHHIRLFGPGTYTINTDNENEGPNDTTAECTTAMLVAGTCTPSATASKNITFTVGAGQIGAHMLFDWNGNFNIDVVNVWDQNTTWTDPDAGDKNNLWTGARWAGPSGYTVHPQTQWAYVSTDNDGDGIVGVKMIDGPFQGFSANFNLSPTFSCQESPPAPMAIGDSSKVGGCSLGTGNVNLTERGDWWLVAGFLAWLGLIRKRLARQRS